jgi:DNA polymerase elongation subunit (family B)
MYNEVSSLLVLDIETFSKPLAQQDPKILESLTRSCSNEQERQEMLDKLGLYPMTGEVACVGFFDLIRRRPGIFFRQDLGTIQKLAPISWPRSSSIETKTSTIDINLQGKPNEAALLEAIWGVLEKYDCLITFNGRSFDYPFLMQRSFILGVPVKKHLYGNRYHTQKHLDLCDYLTGFGASRRYSLDLWSRTLGLTSPKDHGMDGSQVSSKILSGSFTEVADYCMRDVIATAELAAQSFKTYPNDLQPLASLIE